MVFWLIIELVLLVASSGSVTKIGTRTFFCGPLVVAELVLPPLGRGARMKSSNDEPYKLFSKSERWARLRLVRHILDRTVEQGNVPEEVAERAFEFSAYLETLRQRHHAWPNAEDTAVI